MQLTTSTLHVMMSLVAIGYSRSPRKRRKRRKKELITASDGELFLKYLVNFFVCFTESDNEVEGSER